MKKLIISRISIIALLIILAMFSCEKEESYHQISSLETEIYNGLNDYRLNHEQSKMVMNMIMFKEARELSNQIANGNLNSQSDDIADKLREITSNFGGTNQGWLVVESMYENADSIVNMVAEDESASQLVRQEYTQAGVGAATGNDGITHVCLLFMNIPE